MFPFSTMTFHCKPVKDFVKFNFRQIAHLRITLTLVCAHCVAKEISTALSSTHIILCAANVAGAEQLIQLSPEKGREESSIPIENNFATSWYFHPVATRNIRQFFLVELRIYWFTEKLLV